MNVVTVANYREISVRAAQLVANQVNKKKNTVLGLATGQTPVGMYQELISMFKRGEVDFFEVVTFNLDEYYGLSPEHPQSYHHFMWDTFFQYINIKKENVHLLNGVTENINKECKQYEYLIQKNGGVQEVPKQALTMGIGTIMKAQKIILLASGRKKAHVIESTINCPVSSEVPATALQLHNDVIILIDKEAAYKI